MTISESIHVPDRIKALPVDERGYPVPWFVSWVDGKPEFRAMDERKLVDAVKFQRCWVCGGPLGAYKAFTIGPMCSINRISAEPPSHRECAIFSAQACPFLTKPHMRRREGGLPADARNPAGEMIRRNPGVVLMWVTKRYRVQRVDNGVLFDVGTPTEVLWFSEGRSATRAEVLESFESGLPFLMEGSEKASKRELDELERRKAEAMLLVPAEAV